MSAEVKDCGCGPGDMCSGCATSEELADGIMRFLAAEIREDSGPALVCPGCGSPDVDLRRGLLCGTCAETIEASGTETGR